MYTIYKLTSPSGKNYIGFTSTTPKKRFAQHKTSWRKWVKGGSKRRAVCTKLFHAFSKHGVDSWTIDTLFTSLDRDEALKAEDSFIIAYDTISNGYNLIPGGFGGSGKKLTREHKDNIAAARLAYCNSDEGKDYLQSLSHRMMGNKNGVGRSNRTTPITDQERANRSKASIAMWNDVDRRKAASVKMKERWESNSMVNTKRVLYDYTIQTPTGEIIEVPNIRQYALSLNLNPDSMGIRLNGAGSYKGYKLISRKRKGA